jgi:hypothetical protein
MFSVVFDEADVDAARYFIVLFLRWFGPLLKSIIGFLFIICFLLFFL